MLMSYLYLFSHQAFYSLRSRGPLLSLLPRKPWDSRLAHTAGILPAQARQKAKAVAQIRFHQAELEHCIFRPLLCHIPWVEDKTPTDTKCSLNVCGAEIMWTHQECLRECLSSQVSGELCQTHWLWHLGENLKYHCPWYGLDIGTAHSRK